MNWFRVQTLLPSHPKVHALADELRLPWQHALGMLTAILAWAASRDQEDIVVTRGQAKALAAVAGYDGHGMAIDQMAAPQPRPEHFIEALIATGWLDVIEPTEPDGPETYRLHHSREWNAAPIRESLAARDRMRNLRSENVRRTQPERSPLTQTQTQTLPTEEASSLRSESVSPTKKPKLESADILQVQVAWNESQGDLPAWRLTSQKRRRAMLLVLKAHPMERIIEAVQRLAASPFATGQNDRGWKADPDFFLRPGILEQVLEGKYDARRGTKALGIHENVGTKEQFAADPYFNPGGNTNGAGQRQLADANGHREGDGGEVGLVGRPPLVTFGRFSQ